jgi:dihydrofolate synthase/folylpolyglutamate synthase
MKAGSPMNYEQAIAFLFSSLPMYQRVGKVAYKSNLENTLALDEYFGHPHRQFKAIHIAGTNGKGSVAHMLAAVCHSAGYKTGLYTSPHLKDFRERIRVNGIMIPEDKVTEFVSEHREIIGKLEPSFFEMTVAMAFDHFSSEKTDIAIVETGMGGRLDSTNIIHPVLSVITNIGMDHSQFLGDTLYKIAGEKAGIIKPGVPVIIGLEQDELTPVFSRKAKEMNCELHFADQEYDVEYAMQSPGGKQLMYVRQDGKPLPRPLEVDLLGFYQQKNLVAVLQSVDVLNKSGIDIPDEDLRSGLADVTGLTGFRGRWEILDHNPLVICDTAHNPEGMNAVVEQIRQTPHKNLHIVLGSVIDKNPGQLLEILPGDANYYFTQASVPRAMNREKLAALALKHGLYGRVCQDPRKALEAARTKAEPEDLIFVGGSTFVVAEVL